MTTIDNDNYELWLVRYADGDLSSDERHAVELWLGSHPQAAEELKLYVEAPRLTANTDIPAGFTPARATSSPFFRSVSLRWLAAAAVAAAIAIPAAISLNKHTPGTATPVVSTATPIHTPHPALPSAAGTYQVKVDHPASSDTRQAPPHLPASPMPERPLAETGTPQIFDEPDSSIAPLPATQLLPATEALATEAPPLPETTPTGPDTIYTNTLIAPGSQHTQHLASVSNWFSNLPVISLFRHQVKKPISDLYADAFTTDE